MSDERPLEEDALVEGAFASQDPNAVFATVVHLSYLRSQYRVGAALSRAFPTEAAWQAWLSRADVVEQFLDLAAVVADVRAGALGEDILVPDRVVLAVQQHYARGLEAIEGLAQELGIPPQDLLTVLVHT